MRTLKQLPGFGQTVIALAVLAAFAPARAQDIAEAAAPGNSISVGVGIASGDEKDRARFGMFNGLRTQSGYGLLGFSYLDRDDASGKWFTLEGRNLGLDNREIGFSYRKLGDLKLWGEYGELVRHDPRTVYTQMQGFGTTNPTAVLAAAPGAGSEQNLELKRKGLSLNAEKWFNGRLQIEVNFKNEDKTGARFFGIGFSCAATSAPGCVATPAAGTPTGNAVFLIPEPVNSTIRQIDVKLNWSGDRLKLSGGYYGSFYTNNNGSIQPTIPGGVVNILGNPAAMNATLLANMQLPIALSPDNQAQQLHVGGLYKITPSTRVNFKYSYTHATQDEDFLNMGLANAPAGRSNLGGVVNTTRAQVGFSAHPWEKVHLHGDIKYNGRSDKTPIARYNIEGVNTFTNGQYSPKIWHGKLEGSYQLPQNYLATGSLEHEREDLGKFTETVNVAGLSGLRQKHKETGWRLELKKIMSETLNGRLSYSSHRRVGDSPWLKPLSLACTGLGGLSNAGVGVIEGDPNKQSITACATFNDGVFSRTAIFPFIFMDRSRDKLKFMADWSATDQLSLNFVVEGSKDNYKAPSDTGLQNAGMTVYSVDADYKLSDAWKLNAYLSRGEQKTTADHSSGYDATLKDIADSFGLGLVGKPMGRYRVGGDLTLLNDKLIYQQKCDPACSATNLNFLATAGGLPDVTYRLLRLKLFGEYALDRASYIRLDFVHQRTLFTEWTYNYNGTAFFYNDNTTLNAKQNQSVSFLGASYVYKFQ